MKYNLISAYAKRDAHKGLMVTAYYQQENKPLEKPFRVTVFNHWPPVELEADVNEYKLDGVYEYPNGKRTTSIIAFSPKTKEGLYLRGFSPAEVFVKHMNVLKKIEVPQ